MRYIKPIGDRETEKPILTLDIPASDTKQDETKFIKHKKTIYNSDPTQNLRPQPHRFDNQLPQLGWRIRMNKIMCVPPLIIRLIHIAPPFK
jgi:hypothetical protein